MPTEPTSDRTTDETSTRQHRPAGVYRTHRGLVRDGNEDSVHVGANLLALADGMGGHAAGEVASALMIGHLAQLETTRSGDLLTDLDDAVRQGNAAIAAHAEQAAETEGMGTTLTAMLFDGARYGLAHVGDSRAYLLRGGELTQLTTDDTFVQTLVDAGYITEEQARTHPRRSLILRALTGRTVSPALVPGVAQPGDRFLLCSDGLSDVVSAESIHTALSTVPDAGQCADQLIESALGNGGPDNVTVIVADFTDG